MLKSKIIRITTVPISLKTLLKGQLKFMSNYFQIIGVSSSGKELEDVRLQENVEVFPIELSRKITPIKDLISLIKMVSFLKKQKPLIVHTHTPKAGIIGMLAAKISGVPIRLHTVAGLPLMEAVGAKKIILNFVEKTTYSCSTFVYPNSFELAKFILNKQLVDSNKLKVIGNGSSNGIDTDYFNSDQLENNDLLLLKEKLGINNDDFVFIYVGRVVSDKGINEVIGAFKDLLRKAKSNERIKLLLVGNREDDLDPLKSETLHEIINNDKIISVGFQKDVRPFFAISSALVFPSYREGFPNVVMQAGAMGIPSIVSDINGCNEIISNGINGLIIPVKDKEAVLTAMERLIFEKELYEKLKHNSRSLIVSRFNQQDLWNGILKEYEKQISNFKKGD